jgi:Mitochondrial carrier protein
MLHCYCLIISLLVSVSFVLSSTTTSFSTYGPLASTLSFSRKKSSFSRRRSTPSQQKQRKVLDDGLQFLTNSDCNDDDINTVQQCSISFAAAAAAAAGAGGGGAAAAVVKKSILSTLLRGSLLRITSDLSGGTPLESIKTRVTITKEGPWEATRNIFNNHGLLGFYTGTPSRTIEGALIGAVFMLGSVATKRQLISLGCPPTLSALAGGLVGGVAQSIVMTPAGMIFTSLSASRNNQNSATSTINDNAITICQRVIKEKGIGGLYIGIGPMCLRQATNWASRSGFTEIARSTLKLSQYGLYGELISGIIGGVGSCWNTPIETIRVFSQRDVCIGNTPKSMKQYWSMIVTESGYPGLFRGITPRAIQAIWQTTFLVVVPNIMGV